MHNGVLVVEGCYYGDWMTEIIRSLRGHHEPQEEFAFHHMLERLATDTPSPTMLELGAFWAYYTLWLLRRLPQARAILVEPDPNNLEVGLANLALNGCEAEYLQAAVGRERAVPQPFACESDGQTRLVPTESLPSLLDRFSVAHLDLLLMDIQGAELELLEGARPLLAERVRFLMVSTHHHLISGDPLTHQRCLDLIRSLGGNIIAEHTVAESFSGDGLIAASFDARDSKLRVPISYARAGESLFGDPLTDLAHTAEAARVTAVELDIIKNELAGAKLQLFDAHAQLADLRNALEMSRGDAVSARAELTEITKTVTWRLHQRLSRSRFGRALLGLGSRAARVVRS
jgi:FkbM family methyltransferase